MIIARVVRVGRLNSGGRKQTGNLCINLGESFEPMSDGLAFRVVGAKVDPRNPCKQIAERCDEARLRRGEGVELSGDFGETGGFLLPSFRLAFDSKKTQ